MTTHRSLLLDNPVIAIFCFVCWALDEYSNIELTRLKSFGMISDEGQNPSTAMVTAVVTSEQSLDLIAHQNERYGRVIGFNACGRIYYLLQSAITNSLEE